MAVARTYRSGGGQWRKLTGPSTITPGGATSSATFVIGYATASTGPFVDLDGVTLTGAVYVQAVVSNIVGQIARVSWYLDDVLLRDNDLGAPFNPVVGNTSIPLSWWGAAGNHDLRATILFADGTVQNETATVTIGTPPAPPPPPVITGVGSAVNGTGVIVSWTTSTPATSRVEYGVTTAYGSLSTLSSTLRTSHAVALTLAANTLYHYRVRSIDAYGQETISGDFTFTTGEASAELHGFDRNATNTGIAGVGLTRADLTRVTTSLTSTAPGQVFYRLFVDGGTITIRHPRCVIRECEVVSPDGLGQFAIAMDYETGPESDWLLIEDTTVDAGGTVSAGARTAAIGNTNFIVRRCNVRRGTDCIKAGRDAIIEDSYIHEPIRHNQTSDGKFTHSDAIQDSGSNSGGNVTIRRNRIEGPYQQTNGAIQAGASSSGGNIVGLTVDSNHMSGGNVCCRILDNGSVVVSATLTNNTFERGSTTGTQSQWWYQVEGVVVRSGNRLVDADGSNPVAVP